MTQWYLAHISGLDEGYIKQIETGRRPVSRKVARALSECTGVSEEWLLVMNPSAPMTNVSGTRYKKEDFDKALDFSEIDSDPLSTHFLAFKYAIRVERMIRMLGEKGKEFLMRFPLAQELEKLEKKFKIDTLYPDDDGQDDPGRVDGNDWQSGAETFSERWIRVRNEFNRKASALKKSASHKRALTASKAKLPKTHKTAKPVKSSRAKK